MPALIKSRRASVRVGLGIGGGSTGEREKSGSASADDEIEQRMANRRSSIRASMIGEWTPPTGSALEEAIAGYAAAAGASARTGAAEDATAGDGGGSAKKKRSSKVKSMFSSSSSKVEDSDDEEGEGGPAIPTNIVGKYITETHKQYALTYAMMLGIRTTLSAKTLEEFQDPDRDLVDLATADFKHIDKITFRPEGSVADGRKNSYNTPPHKLPHKFVFKDYCPKVYRQIRAFYGIQEEDYMLSMCGEFHFIEFMTNSKSGEWFYYSGDAKYLIKTMSKEESKFMRKLLPHYFDFLRENPHTFINPFFGMHRVQMSSFGQQVYFMVLGSVFDTKMLLHTMYDLKGSSQGRLISEEDKLAGKVRKDLNLTADGIKFHLGPKNRDLFLQQVAADTHFCQSNSIMDYSMLVGVHDGELEKTGSTEGRRFSSVRASDSSANDHASLGGDSSGRVSWAPEGGWPGEGGGGGGVRPSRGVSMGERPGSMGNPSMASIAELGVEMGGGMGPVPVGPCASPFREEQGGIRSRDEDGHRMSEVYFFGIIDILQTYNRRKQAETFFKGFKHKKYDISCVEPPLYSSRFTEFMTANSE
eukprot:CAMPEP_0182566816 /NCGR_PEP_ID=MMETSP1324-20130603/8176_1 /TAXON_ID=236786 /ORGANISM="Florenciella sp., Strain RCC1587" /LENGTH=586 /DNA_ID=CAMNT_0024780687 /DNA_START=8 /DNA_END=1768 /DNA_ORIENTATION=+